jgi:hypothetical protein
MRIIRRVKTFFIKQPAYFSLFTSAMDEGIRDMFKEMGYQLLNHEKKNNESD